MTSVASWWGRVTKRVTSCDDLWCVSVHQFMFSWWVWPMVVGAPHILADRLARRLCSTLSCMMQYGWICMDFPARGVFVSDKTCDTWWLARQLLK